MAPPHSLPILGAGLEFWRLPPLPDKPFLPHPDAQFYRFLRFLSEVILLSSRGCAATLRMRYPGSQSRLVQLAVVSFFALALVLRAESPPSATETRPAKTAPARTRPQVIYHVRPASNYAATLHSQQKTQGNELPIDESMPTSLQISRSNANAAAAEAEARARQEAAVKQRQPKRPRLQRKQMVRPAMSLKSRGHGRGHKH